MQRQLHFDEGVRDALAVAPIHQEQVDVAVRARLTASHRPVERDGDQSLIQFGAQPGEQAVGERPDLNIAGPAPRAVSL